jgi:ribosomal-protein-alanine N-acetyltransferase
MLGGMLQPVLIARTCRLRPYRADDVAALRAIADDPLVARWMTANFPSPYTRADADAWIALTTHQDPPQHFAIEVDGSFAGSIGVMPRRGEQRGAATFGYWIGRRYWGRGIATDAARTVSAYALREQGLRRLDAWVFAPNAASARVLEKAGFTFEGRLREAAVQRDGVVCDMLMYGRVATDPEPPA